jgi:WD40 repeat protein
MEKRSINASLSTQSLIFKPGGPPVAFEVTVINGSDQFAAFQLEVLAAGASRSSGSLWHRLSPEVSTAKPPGDVTQFKIEIFDTPLPAFVGTINLTVRVFSPQLPEERKLVLRLEIVRGTQPTLLSLELPVSRFHVYPRNSVDILVRVRNLSPQIVEAKLHFEKLAPAWIINSAERRFLLDPGGQAEATFQCQPPFATQAPSQDYPFIVKANSRDAPPTQIEGILEILPVGFVEFTARPQKQTIPINGGWLPDWKSDSASFQLLFKNTSNLLQQVEVQLQGRERRKWTYKLVPEDANLSLGETTKVLLNVTTKRPWLGLAKTLRLEAKALLSDQRLGSTDPSTQPLELRVFPIVPLWLLLALLALLVALLVFLLRPVAIAHTGLVNTVNFSSDAFSVVSGSDDCTIRVWTVDGDHLDPQGIARSPVAASCDGKQPNPKGLLAVSGKAVRTSQFIRKDNDRIAAGLESGEIQLWNVATREKEDTLTDKRDTTSDRVFALVFTEDSRKLFSGHGSGKLRLWQRPGPGTEFEPDPQVIDLGKNLKYPIQSLALSKDESTLVTAGNFKRVILLNPTKPTTSLTQLSAPELNGSDGDFIWSVAFAPKSHILATSDSSGYITMWDLDKCPVVNTKQRQEPVEQKCTPHDRWRAAKSAVRSLAFALDGSYLVSAGDDKKIVVWPLTSESKRDRTTAVNGQVIYEGPSEINTIALTKDVQGTMVVSGSDDFQVRLHRLK